ncbi:MAG: hypothetical protein R3F34_10865 [Planctomycetota bacterium]
MSRIRQSLVLAPSLLLLAGCASTGIGTHRAKVTPQRPTVGNTTQTAAFGTAEIEAGVAFDPSDRVDTAATIRFGLSESSELFVSHVPYVTVDAPGPDPSGPGDLTVGFRQRLLDESKDFPATALEIATSIPIGDDDPAISSGYTNLYTGFTLDRHFGDLLTSWYYRLGLIGTAEAGNLDVQHTLAVAGYMPLMDRWNGVVELASTYYPEAGVEPLTANGSLLYTVTDSLLFDIGVQVGLNDDAQDFAIVAGVTTNIGRIF